MKPYSNYEQNDGENDDIKYDELHITKLLY